MSKGFTLIETVAVMVVIAILTAVLFLRWGSYDDVKLEQTARKLTSDIRYAQQLSISTQQRGGIIFSATGYEVYQIINGPSPALANSSGDPCSTRPSDGKFVVDFTQDRCSVFSDATLSFVNNSLAFNSIGRLVNASTGADLGTQTVTVNHSGTKTVAIDGETGRASY